jgi:hypothetical protein
MKRTSAGKVASGSETRGSGSEICDRPLARAGIIAPLIALI